MRAAPPRLRPWTRAEEIRLETLRLEGLTRPLIARALGRTLAAVKRRVELTSAPYYPPRLPTYLALLSFPHTNADVARRMGVRVAAVKAARTRLRKAGHAVLDSTVTEGRD